jgi:hypothetical protein
MSDEQKIKEVADRVRRAKEYEDDRFGLGWFNAMETLYPSTRAFYKDCDTYDTTLGEAYCDAFDMDLEILADAYLAFAERDEREIEVAEPALMARMPENSEDVKKLELQYFTFETDGYFLQIRDSHKKVIGFVHHKDFPQLVELLKPKLPGKPAQPPA